MKTVHNEHTEKYLTSFNAKEQVHGKRILDVGCGDGYASLMFNLYGAKEIHAYDPFAVPTYIKGNIAFSKFLTDFDKDYDIIWSHHVIEHVEDCFGFLRDIWNRLKPEGQLWIACPNMGESDVYSPDHIHNFNGAQLLEVLKRCGFGIGQSSIYIHKGQLRVRVPKIGSTEYPKPMQDSLDNTGRCPSTVLAGWNW